MLALLESDASLELNFSQWFLIKRRQQSLTQDDVAIALGVSGQSVSNWERGRSIPTLTVDQMKTLCKIFNCTLEEIPSSGDISNE
jgi:DNA-binding XRE family transcriptional regulator